MLLRSSSIPVLGQLLSSFSESPNNHHHSKLSHNPTASLNLLTLSRISSPISPSITQFSEACMHSKHGFRRTLSEGNLEGLASVSSNCNEFNMSDAHRRTRRSNCSMLQTIPSLSFQCSESRYENACNLDKEEENIESEEHELFGNSVRGEEIVMNKTRESTEDVSTEIGVTSCGSSGGGGDSILVAIGGDGGGMEEHYRSLVEENPGSPLLRKQYGRAEEHYSRAILADPEDGETLSLYAKLLWKLHHDQHRATDYFEMAIRAAPEDSHVQAAYASFLWEADETEEEEEDGSHFL